MQVNDKLTLLAFARPGAAMVLVDDSCSKPTLVCDKHFSVWAIDDVRFREEYHLFNVGDKMPTSMYPRMGARCYVCYRQAKISLTDSPFERPFKFQFWGWHDDRA